jgi:methyl-accepting chemotaxis protein
MPWFAHVAYTHTRTSTHAHYLLAFEYCSLFEKCPQAKVLFGFPIDIDPSSVELLTSKRFIMHAAYLVQMLDTALNMLGPDIELLTEIMTELGTKHVRYGVKPEMFPIMGDALMHTLETTLKGDFTDAVRDAWKETYSALSQDMIRAQVKAKNQKGKKQ